MVDARRRAHRSPRSGRVEARDGGTCLVRMVTSGFPPATRGTASSRASPRRWRLSLRTCGCTARTSPGEEGTWLRVYGHGGSWDEGLAALTAALGLEGAQPGDAVAAGDGAPALAGTVEAAETGRWQGHVVLRAAEPAPGLATISAWGDAGTLSVQLCLYGDAGALAAVRELPAWEAWMRERFPQAA